MPDEQTDSTEQSTPESIESTPIESTPVEEAAPIEQPIEAPVDAPVEAPVEPQDAPTEEPEAVEAPITPRADSIQQGEGGLPTNIPFRVQ